MKLWSMSQLTQNHFASGSVSSRKSSPWKGSVVAENTIDMNQRLRLSRSISASTFSMVRGCIAAIARRSPRLISLSALRNLL